MRALKTAGEIEKAAFPSYLKDERRAQRARYSRTGRFFISKIGNSI